MFFDLLPAETVTQIFLSLNTVSSCVALASSCSYFRGIYTSSKKTLFLIHAAECEFGPLDDIVQLLTHNASQLAHIHRSVPISDALIKSIVRTGRVAARWEALYPFKKWKSNFESRRSITPEERFMLRRALYRLWLFTRAFHNAENNRLLRGTSQLLNERAALLHNFTTLELAEMLDVHNVMRDVVAQNICPSNGRIATRVGKRFPDANYQLVFNMHADHPQPSSSFSPESYYNSAQYMSSNVHSKYTPTRAHEPGFEGWGDDVLHYYVVEDYLKLDPEQIIWLKDNAPYKRQVESYVKTNFGDWFDNNGETFVQTLAFVIEQRNEDMLEIRQDIEHCEMGVALNEKQESIIQSYG